MWHPVRTVCRMDIRRELHRLVDDVLGDDPRRALIACRLLTDDHLPWMECKVIALARREGWSWRRIAQLLMRSRQSVFTKHRAGSIALPARRPIGTEADRLVQRMFSADERFRRDSDIAW